MAEPRDRLAQTQGQLAWYRAMEEARQMVAIVDRASLDRHVALWTNDPPASAPIGYILSLEGADSILTPRHLERAHAQGLRAIGPAHYGPGRYAPGTHANGGLGPRGRELLAEMHRLNIILDATHLCDESFWEALQHYHGPVWASHQNCRKLVPGDRQFNDEQIKELIARGAVFGASLDAWMMVPGWEKGKTRPEQAGATLERAIDHMDHICQLAGNARHVGIGSDLDGGFGREQAPADMDTIADLTKLPGLLARRGYKAEDIAGVMHGNFLRFLREVLALLISAEEIVVQPPPAHKPLYAHLYFQVLVAIALGVALGYFYPALGAKMEPLGRGFIKLIKMMIAPIIFSTVVVGIAKMGDMKEVGRVGIKALFYFEVVTTLALVIGLVVVNVARPAPG